MSIPIGRKIKELRSKREKCQKDICCDFLSQAILSKIENNKMLPSIPQLQYISDCLNVPISYFFEADESFPDASENDSSTLFNLYSQKRYDDILYLYESNKLINLKDINKNFYVGMSYYRNELYNSSFKALTKYISDYRESDNAQKSGLVINYATALNILHCIMLKNSSFEKAIRYLQKARNELLKYEKTDDKIYHVVINNIGTTYCKFYKFDKAIEVLEGFLDMNKENVFLPVLSSIHLTLNLAYYKTNNYEHALIHIQKSIWLFKYTGERKTAGECYLNYINCLRATLKLDAALNLISMLKDEYSDDRDLLNLFLIQEMIVLFNEEKYNDLLLLSSKINTRELRKRSRMEYFFMLGHTEFCYKNYSTAYNHLIKCEKYMIGKKFYTDLSLLYQDLSIITGDKEYADKSLKYKDMEGIYNIVLKNNYI